MKKARQHGSPGPRRGRDHSELHRDHLREVPSSEIGKKVIEKLYAIDPVAYIRYVSVYRQFSNVEEFIQEITQMRHQTLIDPLQRKLPIL